MNSENTTLHKKDNINLLMNKDGIFLNVNNDKYRLCSHPYAVNLETTEDTEFIRNYLIPTEDIFVLKEPVEIANVQFRITLRFRHFKFLSLTMVAVNKKSNKPLTHKPAGPVHEMWLKSLFGKPTEKTLFGPKYVYDTLEIRKAYDVTTDSDVIIMHYPYTDTV